MENMPLLSIIVPVFQVELFLPRCIESLENQTYPNLEIILVDDGSTDSSPMICEKYAAKNKNIRVIHQKNSGLSAARNAGLRIARGEYIGFVDSDDYIEPDMYEVLYKLIKEKNADLAVCNYDYVDMNRITLRSMKSPMKDECFSGKEALEKVLEQQGWYYVTAWNKLYKAKMWDGFTFPEGKIHEDEFVIHNIYLQCLIIVSTSKILYHYVQNQNSIMHSEYSIGHMDSIEAMLIRILNCYKIMGCLWTARMMWVIDAKIQIAREHVGDSQEILNRWMELKEKYNNCKRELPAVYMCVFQVYRLRQKFLKRGK